MSWSSEGLPPRWSVFPQKRRIIQPWEWRAVRAKGENGDNFILLVQVLPSNDNSKAWLIFDPPGKSRAVVARLEQHGGMGEGLHIHSQCDNDELIAGPDSIEASQHRLPSEHARRTAPWTKEGFWAYACKRFNIVAGEDKPEQGSLAV